MFKQFINFFLKYAVIGLLVNLSVHAHSEAYFSPDDHPTDRLIQLINTTKHKIHAAIYMLTDKEIAQSLINAKKRGVDVKLIVDRATMDSEFGKGKLLKNSGIDIFVFSSDAKDGKAGRYSPLMHNKFAVFDQHVWTGSFNWTKSANQKNQENVIITTNKKVYVRFEKQFEVLKRRAVPVRCHCRSEQKQEDDYSIDVLWRCLKEILGVG